MVSLISYLSKLLLPLEGRLHKGISDWQPILKPKVDELVLVNKDVKFSLGICATNYNKTATEESNWFFDKVLSEISETKAQHVADYLLNKENRRKGITKTFRKLVSWLSNS